VFFKSNSTILNEESTEEIEEGSPEGNVINRVQRTSKRMDNIVKWMVYINFLMPVVVLILFTNPLSKTYLVPDVMSPESFLALKVLTVIITCVLRSLTFREELQFQFNESYILVQRLMLDKNAQVFKYIKLRIQENFLSTWYFVFQ